MPRARIRGRTPRVSRGGFFLMRLCAAGDSFGAGSAQYVPKPAATGPARLQTQAKEMPRLAASAPRRSGELGGSGIYSSHTSTGSVRSSSVIATCQLHRGALIRRHTASPSSAAVGGEGSMEAK
jgi:hypothetical protein